MLHNSASDVLAAVNDCLPDFQLITLPPHRRISPSWLFCPWTLRYFMAIGPVTSRGKSPSFSTGQLGGA
eukprot:1787621-Amphidinium_carterae.1